MARPQGSKNRFGPTDTLKRIYELFVRPFIKQYVTHDSLENVAIDAFFNSTDRKVYFCKAKEPFRISGPSWASESEPFRLVPGAGRRHVEKGQPLVLRLDRRTPDRSELEFDGQVFVLSKAELALIQEKIEVVA